MFKLFIKLNQRLNQYELLLILLLFMVVLRIPSLFEPHWYGDENIYLAIGQAMRMGDVIYLDVTDYPNKPPAIYVLAALAQNVFQFRLLLLLWQIPAVIFFYKLASKLFGNVTTSFFSTLSFVYLTSSPLFEGNIANAENFFVVPVVGAVMLLYDKKRLKTNTYPPITQAFYAGLLLGLAFLFKIHVALDILMIGMFFYIFPLSFEKRWYARVLTTPSLWVFIIGLIIPVVLTLAVLFGYGITPLGLLQTMAGSSAYVSAWDTNKILFELISFSTLTSRTLLLGLVLLGLFVSRNKIGKSTLLVCMWLVCSLYASLLSGRPYPHYLLQAIAPLVLMVALLSSITPVRNKLVVLGFFGLFAISYVRFDFSTWSVTNYYNNFIKYITKQRDRTEYYQAFDSRMPRNYQVARLIRQTTNSADLMFVWGTESDLYVLSQRKQAGPLVTSFHVQDLNYYHQLANVLTLTLPKIIVVMEEEQRLFPQLESLLSQHYLLADKIGNPLNTPTQNKGHNALVYRKRVF